MSRLPFGTRVHVTAVVEPRYLTCKPEHSVADHGPRGTFLRHHKVPVDPPVLIDPRHGDIGDPLPHTTDVPASGLHRRLRRFGRDVSGVVVGWVWRAEGHYQKTSYHFENYQNRPYLEESGRHRLYQVAVDPGEVGKRFAPAYIVLVHPDDLEVQP